MMPLIHSLYLATLAMNLHCFRLEQMKLVTEKEYHSPCGKDQHFPPTFLFLFVYRCDNFEAGNTRNYLHAREIIISGNELIQTATGLHLEIASPSQQHYSNYPMLSAREGLAMPTRYKNELRKKVIEPTGQRAFHKLLETYQQVSCNFSKSCLKLAQKSPKLPLVTKVAHYCSGNEWQCTRG